MDPVEDSSVSEEHNSEEQQSQTEEAESSVRPTLSQVKKSWGFRRTTIARREFMEEVGDLTRSPPPLRRGRSRRNNQTPQTTTETRATKKAKYTAKSVIDELEWSSPSSPVSVESKPASEASAGGSLDPSMWQDFGSAFHTAFSLLGGNEGLSMDISDSLTTPDILKATDATETVSPQAIDETEVPDNLDLADEMQNSQPIASDNVAGGVNEVVFISSSQEEDSDEMTLKQIKEQLASKRRRGAGGGKGGRGKAKGRGRGRGRGRGKARGRGRGIGRTVEPQSSTADDDDEMMVVNAEHLQEEDNDKHGPTEIEISSAHSDVTLSPAQRSNSDCIIIDTDLDQATEVTPDQYDDAPEEDEEKQDYKNEGAYSSISDSEGYDSNALYCICRQKHNKRFMICCDSCQEWFHGDCVGVSETQGRKMEKKGQDYICPPCATKKQLQAKPESELSFPECVTVSPCGEQREEQLVSKEVVVVVEKDEEEAPVMRPEPEAETQLEMDSSLPLCIGPGCSKMALQDSVYCGTDCIIKHAAFTMKMLPGPKVPQSKERTQKKADTARPLAKGQSLCRMSKRLAGKAKEESQEEEMREDDGGNKEASSVCDPSLTEVQAPSISSPNVFTASKKKDEQLEDASEAAALLTQPPEDTGTDAVPSSQHISVPAPPLRHAQEKGKEPVSSQLSKQPASECDPTVPSTPAKPSRSPAAQSPTSSVPRHHETGALMVNKTAYVIPKKQAAPNPPSVSASAGCQKSPAAPSLLNETRNLLVPPAPSAPSSRPSQPNNQVRQSIQRSLTSILFKRVCDCEDLEMSETDAAKLVASIEMEMFDIFRNTDSKYMNKYRTIMFNLKDSRNKGLLYRVVQGEIGPFRLVRMSQKDMQAIKVPETTPKESPEVKDPATCSLPKPEAVKVDLPSLNPPRPDRRSNKRSESLVASQEQKRSAPALKTRTIHSRQTSATPDILTCMLKDTTSEHKAHLFDLKCRICTGQIPAGEEDEPTKKKPRFSETRDKHEPSWRKYAGDDSPLQAPPDSPDMDFSKSGLIIDSPRLTIVESPASPIMDSPASPTLESPASPFSESPASPTQDISQTTTKKTYTPVVIPAVSTVTITRRDPRTAASRFSNLSRTSTGPSNITHNQPASDAHLNDNSSASPSVAPAKTVPKSILMKPSSSADPRLYGTSTRTVISKSSADGETAHFLAKQDIMWKGFLNMLNVAKFLTKGYLVSGSAENLKMDLPDTIQIGGRILPETVWDYVAKLKTSTKELCVIRFQPATEEEEVAYVSLFSYFNSRGRFGVVANSGCSIKDIYLVPLSAKESIPPILQPLEGPGLEKNRPNLLLGLAITQRVKRPGGMPQETEEKRPNVPMSKDPMWIPKPPALYGSDKLEVFQPYDRETPSSVTSTGSPSCPESPSESSSSATTSVSTPAVVASPSSNCSPTAASSEKTPLQTILKTLFCNKQTDSPAGSEGNSSLTVVSAKNVTVFPHVAGSLMDPIVQQYGQKSKVKEVQEEDNYFDRPYDPEEEYNPSVGYTMVVSQNKEEIKKDGPPCTGFVEDDTAYDPEDESIFEVIQSDTCVKKAPAQISDPSKCSTQLSTEVVTVSATTTPVQATTATAPVVIPSLPTGSVVVSAATLTEQQRMLEELNKQIEEQKRQLKEQEEALRQQREAVGMFMAHFSVSDSLLSPPTKSLPLSKLTSLENGITQTQSMPSESTDRSGNPSETVDIANVDSQSVKLKNDPSLPTLKSGTDKVTEESEMLEKVEDGDKYSAGEIEDSDVAYDPEDESLFNLIQEDVFQQSSTKTHDSSEHSSSRKGVSTNSHQSRKRRSSPKRRRHRDRDSQRSPSRRSQHRSPSHAHRRRERDRHRRSERDRSRHRARNQTERQGRHGKEHFTHRHSHGHKRSPSSPTNFESLSFSPKHSPHDSDKSKQAFPSNVPDSVDGEFIESNTASSTSAAIKNDLDGQHPKCNPTERPVTDASSHSNELKLEISETPKSQDCQNILVSCLSTVDKPSPLETWLESKIESTIPLREIDPPTRDSPQSPDPEPQFLRTSNTEKSDSVKTEKVTDCASHTSVSMPINKFKNTFTPVGVQAPMHQATTVEGPDLKQPELRDQQEGHINPGGEQDIQGSGSEIYLVTKHPMIPGLDLKGPRGSEQQSGLRETGKTFSGLDRRDSGIQGMCPNMWGFGLHVQDPGVSREMQAIESSRVQGLNPEVKELSSDMRQCKPGMGEATLNINCSEVDDPSLAIYHSGCSQMDVMAPDITRRDRDQKERRESQGPSLVDSKRVERCNENPVLEFRGHQKGGFLPHGRNADRSTDLGDGVLPTGRLSPPITHEGQGPQKWLDESRPGQYKAMSGSDTRGDKIEIHSRSPSRDIGQIVLNRGSTNTQGINMFGLGADKKNYQTGHNERGSMSNITNQDSRHPGLGSPYMRGHGGQDKSLGPHIRDPVWSGPDIRDNRRGLDGRGSVMQDEWGGTPPDRKSPNMDIQRPDKETERSRPAIDVPVYGRKRPGSPDFRRPELKRSGPTKGSLEPDMSGRVVDKRGPDLELPGARRWEPVGPHFIGRGTEGKMPPMKDPELDTKRPPDADFSGPWTKRSPAMAGLGSDRRGPGAQDPWGPGPERRGLANKGVGSDWRGREGPDFGDTGLERQGPAMEGPRIDRRGHEGPDFRPGPQRRVPVMEGPGISWREPEGPDFRPGPDRSRSGMEGNGTDRRRLEGPYIRGSGAERRMSAMESHGDDRRGPEFPDFRGPVPERRCLFLENHGPGGPDFSGPGSESRGQATDCPWIESPECLDFSGHGPERRGPSLEGSGTEWGESEDPDFRVPESRILSKECLGPRRGGPGRPDVRGIWPDNRGTSKGGQGPDGRGVPNFTGQRFNMRGPCFESQEPYKKEARCPDFQGQGPERRDPEERYRRSWCERRGHSVESEGLIRRGPGNEIVGGLGPDKRGTYMGGSRPDFIGMETKRTDTDVDNQGKGGPQLRDPGSEKEYSNMEGLGPERRRGGGPNIRESEPEPSGLYIEDPRPVRRPSDGIRFRSTGPERRPPDIEGTENIRNFLEGPVQFRDPRPAIRPPAIDDPEFNVNYSHYKKIGPETTVVGGHGRAPDVRAAGCEFRGPGPRPNTNKPDGSHVRNLDTDRRDGPRPDWRRSFGTDLRSTDIRQRGLNTEVLRHDRRNDWKRDNFEEAGTIQEGMEGPGPDSSDQNLWGSRSMWRKMGPGPDNNSVNQNDPWGGTDTEEQWSDRRGPNMGFVKNEREYGNRGPWLIHQSHDEQGQGSRQGPHNNWRGTRDRVSAPIQERASGQFPGPARGPRDDWNTPGYRGPESVQDNRDMMCPGQDPRGETGNEWREPDRGDTGPNRRGREAFFRGERNPNNTAQVHDKGGQGFRDQGSNKKGGPNMENDGRQFSHFQRRGGHTGGRNFISSCPDRGGFKAEGLNRIGPGGTDLRCTEPGNRISNIEGQGDEGTFSDFGGLGFERQEENIKSHGPIKQEFEHMGQREKRGPAPNGEGKSLLGFDRSKNQQSIKPQRHRAALLPTPTEGLIRFPNPNSNVFSPNQKEMRYSADREWSGPRLMDRKRQVGKREEQERIPAGKINTSIDGNKRGGKEKNNDCNESDKQGIFGASPETDISQGTHNYKDNNDTNKKTSSKPS